MKRSYNMQLMKRFFQRNGKTSECIEKCDKSKDNDGGEVFKSEDENGKEIDSDNDMQDDVPISFDAKINNVNEEVKTDDGNGSKHEDDNEIQDDVPFSCDVNNNCDDHDKLNDRHEEYHEEKVLMQDEVKISKTTKRCISFKPVDGEWKENTFKNLPVQLSVRKWHKQIEKKRLKSVDPPSSLTIVSGDGNCNFRCISHVSGCQAQHKAMRNASGWK